MLKLIGVVILVASGGLAGILVAWEYAKKPRELKALLSTIQMLETEITFAATPLAEALHKIAKCTDPHIAVFLQKAAHYMQLKDGCTSGEAWHKALKWYYTVNSLNKREMTILYNLGNVLGMSDIEDQKKHLNLASEQLKREIIRADEEEAKNAKIWTYLGFCGSLVMAIVLY